MANLDFHIVKRLRDQIAQGGNRTALKHKVDNGGVILAGSSFGQQNRYAFISTIGSGDWEFKIRRYLFKQYASMDRGRFFASLAAFLVLWLCWFIQPTQQRSRLTSSKMRMWRSYSLVSKSNLTRPWAYLKRQNGSQKWLSRCSMISIFKAIALRHLGLPHGARCCAAQCWTWY